MHGPDLRSHYSSPVDCYPESRLLLPALMLLPFLRRGIGEHAVRPGLLITMAAAVGVVVPFVCVFGYAVSQAREPGFLALTLFSAAYLVIGLTTWSKRRMALTGGEPVAAYDLGTSWLAEMLPFPPPLTEVVIIPALVIGFGLLLTHTFLVVLGYWLLACGASLSLLSWWEARHRRLNLRHAVDDVLYGRASQANARRAQQAAGGRQRGNAGAAGADEYMAGGE